MNLLVFDMDGVLVDVSGSYREATRQAAYTFLKDCKGGQLLPDPLFSLEERTELARAATAHLPNVRVEPFDGLLVEFARSIGAQVIVKGLRAVTDFEYEFQMAALNYQLSNDLETVFIMSPPQYMYLSSSIVREVSRLGGDVSSFVPPCVQEALAKRYRDGVR